jgi:NitT/TauT family transport system substrate-binding protein
MLPRALLPIALTLACGVFSARAQEVVRIATAPAIGSGATLIAIERGYFREVGIKVAIDNIDSSANGLALLAQNRYQIVEGGISAGYFNAIAKGLPITMVMSRATTPVGHALMLRSDLKDRVRTIMDLKGRVIATNGPGSVSSYEIGKMLETADLTIADVDLKILPFSQYALAFENKAIDAALAILPFTMQLRDKGFAIPFVDADTVVEPRPITISAAMINTDWANANATVAQNFFFAYLRGVRDHCQAYHGGSTRKEIIDLLVRTGTERRPEILHEYPWPARDPNGKISVESLLDMQAWYAKNKFISVQLPARRLVDPSLATGAVAKLKPFVVENAASTLAGCR